MNQNNPNFPEQPYRNQGHGEQQSNQQQYDQNHNQFQNQGNYNDPYQGAKLPADNVSMVLAIIATVLFVMCCCFFGYYFALVLSTIGFIVAYTSIKKYQEQPGVYSARSYNKVKNAKIYNLVVLIISLMTSILSFTPLFMSFTNLDNDRWNRFYEKEPWESDDVDEEMEESPSEDEWYYYEEEMDSLEIKKDTTLIEVEEIIEE